MRPRFLPLLCLLLPAAAQAHLGSPDVFYDGMVGPWPARITIRMPVVVPGRAEIVVQVQSKEPVVVTFMPLSAKTAVSNAPPPETAAPAPGETNLCAGELWLMTGGAYSILVRIRGPSAEGSVQIPVNSVATAQLPLPPLLGWTLLALGLVLLCGGVAIVAAAAGESVLPPGALAKNTDRRKYWVAASVTGIVLALGLVGGRKWWSAEEKNFRARLVEGGWPDLAAEARVEGSQRILGLTLGKGPQSRLELAPDHGKLMHLFLFGRPNHQAFGHIHPVRRGETSFEAALPPLPEGDYELYCDLTFDSGFSSTATNFVHLPPIPRAVAPISLPPDPDDSWTFDPAAAVRENPGGDTVCRLPGGTQITWKAHSPLRRKRDAALRFEVLDPAGKPAHLQPYMGMMGHAAVLRSDGAVFVHLHPSGNYSMAAQVLFDTRMAKENGSGVPRSGTTGSVKMDQMDQWCGQPEEGGGASLVSFPYEFPTVGDYRIWVQIKTGNQIQTAVFDTMVKQEADSL
jgi:hypothetical protein